MISQNVKSTMTSKNLKIELIKDGSDFLVYNGLTENLTDIRDIHQNYECTGGVNNKQNKIFEFTVETSRNGSTFSPKSSTHLKDAPIISYGVDFEELNASSFCLANTLSPANNQVEDCLLDLDNYLSQMDKETSVDYHLISTKLNHRFFNRNFCYQSLPNKQYKASKYHELNSSNKMRKTVSCDHRKRSAHDDQSNQINCIDFRNIHITPDMTKNNFDESKANPSGLSMDAVANRQHICKSSNNVSNMYKFESRLTKNRPVSIIDDSRTHCSISKDNPQRSLSAPPQIYSRDSCTQSTQHFLENMQFDFGAISIPPSVTISTSRVLAQVSNIDDNPCIENSNNITLNESPTLDGQSLDQESIYLQVNSGFNSEWPHCYSRTLALTGCTLGVFNIARFALLTINHGGSFILQFWLLSFIFGIPLFWLQMCLGAKIRAGPVAMWKITPICSGVGIVIVLLQFFLAIYSSISVTWIFVYIRDILVVKNVPNDRWHKVFLTYNYTKINFNQSFTSSIANYFNNNKGLPHLKQQDSLTSQFNINDRMVFYLALIWSFVFLVLCKGLKSFGRLVFIIYTFPLAALIIVTIKFVYEMESLKLQNIFSTTDFEDFFVNLNTWTAATQETFLTWGLLGASVIGISSRSHSKSTKYCLRRDAVLLMLITFIILSITAFLATFCAEVLKVNGLIYVPGSFERPENQKFLFSLKLQSNLTPLSLPPKWLPHYSSFVGETYMHPKFITHRDCGYQAIPFISEVLPVVIGLMNDSLSWRWAIWFFCTFAVFGLTQLCVMWKPISNALGNSTRSVMITCVTGFLLSIPFASNIGISLLYYMDFIFGGSWIVPILWVALIFGVFLISGRPYNGDDLVNDLRMASTISAFLALSWNVLLPIGLTILSIINYKVSLSNQLYSWREESYFNYWHRRIGGILQVGMLLIIPITALVQIYRYLTNGPADILERVRMLYRPFNVTEHDNREICRRMGYNNINELRVNDVPPKYTPPPSYTTATGARLAKILHQSLRRSVRRVLGHARRRAPSTSQNIGLNDRMFEPEYNTTGV